MLGTQVTSLAKAGGEIACMGLPSRKRGLSYGPRPSETTYSDCLIARCCGIDPYARRHPSLRSMPSEFEEVTCTSAGDQKTALLDAKSV